MRHRRLVSFLAAAAAAGVAAPAAAFTWAGRVGMQYSQDDAWTSERPHEQTPRLDVNLGLTLDGFVYRPGVFKYGGGVEYRRETERRPHESESVEDALSYRARAVLFGDPRTPLSLSLDATRTTEQVDPGTPNAVGLDLVAQTFGAALRYSQPERPTATLSYNRSDSTSHTPLRPDAVRTLHTVGAGTSHGGPGFSYSANYLGGFSEGTYAADAYDNHRVNVFAKASLAERTDTRLSDVYYLRVPKNDSPFNPRQEVNSLTASMSRHRSGGDFQLGTYRYSHGVQSAAALASLERSSHQLAYSMQQAVRDTPWRLRGNVELSLSDNRLGDEQQRDAGQTLGGSAIWRRQLKGAGLFEVRGGAMVGALEPDGEDALVGYGGSAGATFSRRDGVTGYEVLYDVTYASDLGERGTSLRQQAQGSADAPAGGGVLRGQLTLSAQRRDAPLLGAGGYRSAAFTGSYRWHRYSAAATIGVTSGLAAAVEDAGSGDGLFLSLPYNSHTYTGSVIATAGLTTRLSVSASGRLVSLHLPDRPEQSEMEARGTLQYSIGALVLAIENRYAIAEVPEGTSRRNLLFVSASRSFGTRY